MRETEVPKAIFVANDSRRVLISFAAHPVIDEEALRLRTDAARERDWVLTARGVVVRVSHGMAGL
jgi:hypothetical protein